MNYYLRIATPNKAKADIDHLLEQLGFRNLAPHRQSRGGIGRFVTKLLSMGRLLCRLRRDDVLFLQYPMKKFYRTACRLAHLRGAKVVTVVHDLGAFRRRKLTDEQERRLLSQTDFLIVHNEAMRRHLIEQGHTMPLFSLDIFDYRSDAVPHLYAAPTHPYRLVFAGGLGRHRSRFLYDLDRLTEGFTLTLYGTGMSEEERRTLVHTTYKGHVAPDTFIAEVEADFGLVWDGDSLDECTGAWGEYLKINNPHKTSFYLRAGLPVIVWEQAAMAPFVAEHRLGLTVGSLRELPARLAALSPEAYAELRRNALEAGRRLGEFHYMRRALNAAAQHLHSSAITETI